MPEKRFDRFAGLIEFVSSAVSCVSGVFMVDGAIGYAEAKEKTDAFPINPTIQMVGCLAVSVLSGALAAYYHEA